MFSPAPTDVRQRGMELGCSVHDTSYSHPHFQTLYYYYEIFLY
jgi:uncharacterized Zn-finger protein